MRKLAGYLCHLASCRLHEAAVELLCGPDPNPEDELFTYAKYHRVDPKVLSGYDPETGWVPLELADVAPHLSAAVDVLRDKIQHARWLAGIVGLERMTKNRHA